MDYGKLIQKYSLTVEETVFMSFGGTRGLQISGGGRTVGYLHTDKEKAVHSFLEGWPKGFKSSESSSG